MTHPTAEPAGPTAVQLRGEVFARAHARQPELDRMGGDRQAWVLALSQEARALGLAGTEHHLAVVFGLAQMGYGS